MPPINPTPDQLAARGNPTPVNLNLPAEGTIFRAVGDTGGDAVYQVKNGQLVTLYSPSYTANTGFIDKETGTTYKAGDISTNPHDVQWLDPTYRGAATSRINAFDLYKKQTGSDATALPEFNMADIQGVLQKNGGKLPGQTSVTINGADTKADVTAQLETAKYLPGGEKAPPGTQLPGSAAPGSLTGNPLNAGASPNPLTPASTDKISSNAPGGSATNLYDYYTQQGKQLPSVTDRATIFQTLGLGKASDYKGTVTQNEDLLSALQRKDYAGTTLGTNGASTATGPGTTNSTPAGVSLAAALSGTDANTTLQNYKTYLSSALGVAATRESNAEKALGTFFSSQKSATQILQEELDRRGITQEQSLLSDLDKQIREQTKRLKDLPENIRTTLQDVGVSQAQLERLTVSEAKKPTELLNDLLTNRGALADDIKTALAFAEKFADTRIADQAAKLSALQWEVTNAQGQYKDLSDDAKQLVLKSIDDRKSIMDMAYTAATNGANTATIDKILASKTPEDAIRNAGSALVKPKTTSATTQLNTDLVDAGNALEVGVPSKGYNGRGPDGYVDPNLYMALYAQAAATYGAAGAAQFIQKHPPAKDLNPANIGRTDLPSPVANALQAGQKKGVTIDASSINAALDTAGAE